MNRNIEQVERFRFSTPKMRKSHQKLKKTYLGETFSVCLVPKYTINNAREVSKMALNKVTAPTKGNRIAPSGSSLAVAEPQQVATSTIASIFKYFVNKLEFMCM